MIKTILKNEKRVYFPRGTHVDATWHSRPRGSATGPTQRLRGDVMDAHIYIYILYGLKCIAFRLSKGIITPSKPSLIINQYLLLIFFRVGLSPTVYLSAGYVA